MMKGGACAPGSCCDYGRLQCNPSQSPPYSFVFLMASGERPMRCGPPFLRISRSLTNFVAKPASDASSVKPPSTDCTSRIPCLLLARPRTLKGPCAMQPSQGDYQGRLRGRQGHPCSRSGQIPRARGLVGSPPLRAPKKSTRTRERHSAACIWWRTGSGARGTLTT